MGLYGYTLNVIKRNAKADGDRVPSYPGREDNLPAVLERWIGLPVAITERFKERDRIRILALNSLEFICLYGAAAKLCHHAL
jgi:hypothetical protein